MRADTASTEARAKVLRDLVQAGHHLRSGVPGLYGLSGGFEKVIEHLEELVTSAGEDQEAEVIRFPPVLSRRTYERTDHLESMPRVIGALRSFDGDDRAHSELARDARDGEDWCARLSQSDVVMTWPREVRSRLSL